MNRTFFPWLLLLIINMNVMIGAGIFLYPSFIAGYAQSLGFLSFGLVFCIMLPLVLSIAQLAAVHPAQEGGLYVYSAETLGKTAGIATAILYFAAKVISCSIMIRTFVFYLYSVSQLVAAFSMTAICIAVILFLIILNLLDIRIGARLQCGFIVLKILPIVAVFIGGLFMFNAANLSVLPSSFGLFISSLPLALYPMMGFETCCAIGHTAGDARKMARAIIISFFAVTFLYMLFQFFLFGSLGLQLAETKTPITLFHKNYELISLVGISAVMASALGAAYGILYSNSWYAFVLGREIGGCAHSLTLITKGGTPAFAVLMQGLFVALLLLLPDSLALFGKLSVLGVLLSYIIVVVALLYLYKTKQKKLILPRWIAFLSLASCMLMAYLCLKDML